MARRSTITDVARAAGVSVATVDRVLNGRQRVREETALRVYEAARRVDYHAAALIEHRLKSDLPEVRLGFVLQKEKQAFYQAFGAEIDAAVRGYPGIKGTPIIRFSATQAPNEVADLIADMEGNVGAVAATAVNHHAIASSVTQLKAAGIPTFALLSDFAQGIRISYAGLNNLKVGRIAAWMVATAMQRPGKIAIFVGGHRWHGHELRETGFRSFFREYGPRFQLLDPLVNLETRQLTYEATLDLLSRHADLKGIYIAGGGMEGAIEALRETRAPGEVALVVNELTPESRSALIERYVTMVEATPLPALCRDLVGLMVAAATGSEADVPGQHFLQPEIYLPEAV